MKAQNSHSVLLDLPGFVGEWAFSDQVVVEVLGSVVVDSTEIRKNTLSTFLVNLFGEIKFNHTSIV